ncbi:hypothetical protein D3C83_95400 [compost metagenome]
MAKTKPEDGDFEIQDGLIESAVIAVRRERRAPGQNDALHAGKRRDVIVRLTDFRQHALPANLGRDQVRVLAAKVDDCDTVVERHRRSQK